MSKSRTIKQSKIELLLNKLVHLRFNKETLEKKLSEIFGETIIIELGCDDADYLSDWNYMFTSNNEEYGGEKIDIHGATFMITEINCDFFLKYYNMENIKKFSSKGISITREDYESLPLPMYAYEFNDEQMQTLVENIANSLCAYYGYTEKDRTRHRC